MALIILQIPNNYLPIFQRRLSAGPGRRIAVEMDR